VRKSKFSEAQIAMALRQGEAGTPVAEICRKLGISQATERGENSRIEWIKDWVRSQSSLQAALAVWAYPSSHAVIHTATRTAGVTRGDVGDASLRT
jgi:hypothetical protein